MIHDLHRKPVDRTVIQQDRACGKCGYNLRGLKTGGACPECGTTIKGTTTDPLAGWVITDAGAEYLSQLKFASMLIAACGLPLQLGVVWTLVEAPWPFGLTLWPGLTAAAAAAGWNLGVWILTQPRPTPEGTDVRAKEWKGARWAARVTQIAWAVGTPMAVWGAYEAGEWNARMTTPHVLWWAAVATGVLLWLVAFFGLGALALYMARLADWASDTGLSYRLRLVPYATGIGGFLIGLLALLRAAGYQGGGMAAVFVGGLGMVLLLIAVALFALALFSFANLARWSSSSQRAKLESDARRSRRIVERIERGQARSRALGGAVPEGTTPSRPQGQGIPRAENVEPYDVV